MSTTRVTTLQLEAGDQVLLGYGLGVVTVSHIEASGYLAQRDAVIYTVRYRELDVNGDQRGNTGVATSTWPRIDPNLPCGCAAPDTGITGDVVWCHVHGWKDEWPTV